MALAPGENFERYTIEERIGLGGLGEVYRAFDTRLMRRVAIKIIRQDRAHDWSAAAARFLREARVAASLQHPNTVAIHDLGEIRGTLFIVMELIRGATLRSLITDASIPVELKLEWLAGTARGLAAAHEAGIIHRDVKPANIMITAEGAPKVLDFGLAKPVDEDGEGFTTKVGQLLGTPRYMAPEQREGKEVDERSDQYSFGVTAYELLAQRHPDARSGEPTPLRVAAPFLESPIASSIDRMMSVDPRDRFASMTEAAAAIESFARASTMTMSLSLPLRTPASSAARGAQDASTTTGPPNVSASLELAATEPALMEHDPSAPPPLADVTEEMSTRVRVLDPRAQLLANALHARFAGERLGPGGYVVGLRPTEQLSHPLVLVPQAGSDTVTVFGSVDLTAGAAELHAFDFVAMLHAQRGATLPFIDRATYESRVLKGVRAFLREQGIHNFVVVAAPLELRRAFASAAVRKA